MTEEVVVSVESLFAFIDNRQAHLETVMARTRCKSFDDYNVQYGKLSGVAQLNSDLRDWIENSQREED